MRLRNAAVAAATAPIRFYRRFISPLKPPCCRFSPTCSAYAISAIEIHGPLIGSLLALRRILRCNPFGGFGDDPVPERGERGIRGLFEKRPGEKLYKKITTIKDSDSDSDEQERRDAQ